MKRLAAILATALVASAAFAQQKNTLSAFYSNPSLFLHSGYGGRPEGGIGLAIDHAFSPVFSVELAVADERYTLLRSSAVVNGIPTFQTRNVRVFPFDATANYHFFTDSRWKPYAGLGLRYVSTQEIGRGQFNPAYRMYSLDPEVVGGVLFQFRPHLGLVLDAKQLIGNRDLHSDPAFKMSAGFHWRF